MRRAEGWVFEDEGTISTNWSCLIFLAGIYIMNFKWN